MIVKLQESIDQLDGNLNRLNEIYAAGAVEGFDEKTLAPSDQGGDRSQCGLLTMPCFPDV